MNSAQRMILPWKELGEWISKVHKKTACTTMVLSISDGEKKIARNKTWNEFAFSPWKDQVTNIAISTGTVAFDLDINDAMRRKCCTKEDKSMCDECFQIACLWCIYIREVLSHICRVPSEGILVCFSGRRGFHFWVSDYEATVPVRELILAEVGKVHGTIELAGPYERFVAEAHRRFPHVDVRVTCRFIKFDRLVTTQIGHKVRMPFSAHPVTHNIVVPMSNAQLMTPGNYDKMPNMRRDDVSIAPYLHNFVSWVNGLSF